MCLTPSPAQKFGRINQQRRLLGDKRQRQTGVLYDTQKRFLTKANEAVNHVTKVADTTKAKIVSIRVKVSSCHQDTGAPFECSQGMRT